MESNMMVSEIEMNVDRFWSRRMAGQLHEDDCTADVLLENHLRFPSAQVQIKDEEIRKSRSASPFDPSADLLGIFSNEWEGTSSKVSQVVNSNNKIGFESKEVPGTELLDGSCVGDIPCRYTVPRSHAHEMVAVGVCMDTRITPGFSYRIRRLSFNSKSGWLFKGEARELESVGRGYSRRITLKPLNGPVNCNEDYFWTDSNPQGFAFSIQVVSPHDKFTLFDADHQPVGHVEITQLQGSQTEVSHSVEKTGQVEKTVRVKALCKVDWFHDQENNHIIPLSGTCLSARGPRDSCKVIHIRDAKLGLHHGYTLIPGTCSSLRSLKVSGTNISDVPTTYTIVGIETHHQPVIGTYVDERITPGFHYRVQLGGCGKKLLDGRALKLDSLGRGYAKRITFSPRVLNRPEEHFWSDSHPEGFGFEVSAVRAGMKFIMKSRDNDSVLGHAHVFRDDCAPQVELHHSTVAEERGTGILKRVHIDVKCVVSLDLATKEELEPHVMRVSGVATLYKPPLQNEAELVNIEDIGLDSQLNILFFNHCHKIIFYPL